MQFTAILALLAAAGTSLAAPALQPAVSMMAANSKWTVLDFKRTCTSDTTSCTYSFGINDGHATTRCSYKIPGHPAARAAYQNVKCDAYVIGSSWSGQFGDNKGFQTLSIVRKKQIIYPGYTDAQLKSGQAVKPDQSYTPQNLP